MSIIVSEEEDLIYRWQQSLIAYLRTQYLETPTSNDEPAYPGIKVAGGERDEEKGGVDDHHLITVFSPGMTEWGEDPNFTQPVMLIRHYLPKARTMRGDPPDEGPLYKAAWRMAKVLQPVQDSLDGMKLYFRATSIEHDQEVWGVQATLVCFTRNPATVPTPA